MFTQHIGLALCFRNPQTNARSDELTLGHIQLAVDPLLQALLADELRFLCGTLRPGERDDLLGQLAELRVAQGRVENNRIALSRTSCEVAFQSILAAFMNC